MNFTDVPKDKAKEILGTLARRLLMNYFEPALPNVIRIFAGDLDTEIKAFLDEAWKPQKVYLRGGNHKQCVDVLDRYAPYLVNSWVCVSSAVQVQGLNGVKIYQVGTWWKRNDRLEFETYCRGMGFELLKESDFIRDFGGKHENERRNPEGSG